MSDSHYIDLHELAKRESDRVEWKENVADIDQVIQTILTRQLEIFNIRHRRSWDRESIVEPVAVTVATFSYAK